MKKSLNILVSYFLWQLNEIIKGMKYLNISFAGAGRVADTLCRKMYRSGHRILQIASTDEAKANELVHLCDAEWSSELVFDKTADVLFVAVPDNKLEKVLGDIRCNEKTIVAHTAGSYGLGVFPERIRKRAVFYPLQTFTKGRELDFKDLPVMIEASGEDVKKKLEVLATGIGATTYFIDLEARKMLHLAAVFACNFNNYMLTAGKEITDRAGLSFDLLKPLVQETINKAFENGPENSQTGPAVRNDSNTIEKHKDLLSFSPELQKLYSVISQSLIAYYNKY